MALFSEARKDFERAIKIDRGWPDSHNNWRNFLSAKEVRAAIKLSRTPSSCARISASFYSNLGAASFPKSDYVKASMTYNSRPCS